ncbi:hypothetical protein HDU91_001103, partial [Kappamyces sp. JEL0680]
TNATKVASLDSLSDKTAASRPRSDKIHVNQAIPDIVVSPENEFLTEHIEKLKAAQSEKQTELETKFQSQYHDLRHKLSRVELESQRLLQLITSRDQEEAMALQALENRITESVELSSQTAQQLLHGAAETSDQRIALVEEQLDYHSSLLHKAEQRLDKLVSLQEQVAGIHEKSRLREDEWKQLHHTVVELQKGLKVWTDDRFAVIQKRFLEGNAERSKLEVRIAKLDEAQKHLLAGLPENVQTSVAMVGEKLEKSMGVFDSNYSQQLSVLQHRVDGLANGQENNAKTSASKLDEIQRHIQYERQRFEELCAQLDEKVERYGADASSNSQRVQALLQSFQAAAVASKLYASFPEAASEGGEKYLAKHVMNICSGKSFLERKVVELSLKTEQLTSQLGEEVSK